MIKRPALYLAFATILLISFIAWYLNGGIGHNNSIGHNNNISSPTTAAIEKSGPSPNSNNISRLDEGANQAGEPDEFNTQMVQELIIKYGDDIDNPAVQANLFKVREFIISRYPEDGYMRFIEIIRSAFPEQAESILNIIKLMDQYTQWLAENYTQLNDMSPLERDGHLWKKRRALFGDAADAIWSDERALLAQKQRNVQQEIHRLGLATDLSIDEKLYQLTTTLSENYGETAQDLVIDPGMVATVFFNFDSVQQTLKSLPPEDRQAEINRVRLQLGYNEEQVKQAQEKDERRNQRWENGLSYMAERQALVDQLEGDALDTALSALRQTYFKAEAYTIEKEEISGFYRYARPRVYGRN